MIKLMKQQTKWHQLRIFAPSSKISRSELNFLKIFRQQCYKNKNSKTEVLVVMDIAYKMMVMAVELMFVSFFWLFSINLVVLDNVTKLCQNRFEFN